MYLIPAAAAALDVEPPVAHEPVLVEDGPVRAEERVRGEDGAAATHAADRGGDADVEGLAAGLKVRVVTFNKVKIELRKVKLLILLNNANFSPKGFE